MPRKKNLDKETVEIAEKGRVIKELVSSSGWAEVKKRLISFVGANTSVLSLDTKNKDDILVEIAARQMAANILLEWLKEVEGDARQYEQNEKLLQESIESEYMVNY